MLGSSANAEDIVQETYLKWIEQEEKEITHIKAYLVKIVTNKCINYLSSLRITKEKYVGIWLPEPIPDNPADNNYTNTHHALSIGILVLLEKLTPQERAIFILRELFAFDYKEIADVFDKTQDSCRQLFKRAKDSLGSDAKRFRVDLKVHEKMMANFIEATRSGNVEGLIKLLKEDIVLYADGGGRSIPVNGQRLTAALKPVHGRDNVSRFIMSVVGKVLEFIPDFSSEIIITNGMPSIISYSGNMPVGLASFEHDGHTIGNIYIQSNPDKLKRFIKQPL